MQRLIRSLFLVYVTITRLASSIAVLQLDLMLTDRRGHTVWCIAESESDQSIILHYCTLCLLYSQDAGLYLTVGLAQCTGGEEQLVKFHHHGPPKCVFFLLICLEGSCGVGKERMK